jgi:hypothetical protein
MDKHLNSNDGHVAFNHVTFGLPVETFRISAYIALEERLPVVTEYVVSVQTPNLAHKQNDS